MNKDRAPVQPAADPWYRSIMSADQKPFVNPRYEYMTQQHPTSDRPWMHVEDSVLAKAGWQRVWADVTTEGTMVVYRRERPPVQHFIIEREEAI